MRSLPRHRRVATHKFNNVKVKLNASEFPRLTELRHEAGDPVGFYFDIEDDNAIQTKHVREIESDLQALDDAAWNAIKCDLARLVIKRDRKRGWQPLLDKLNEVKGYRYLVGSGYTDVHFIPRATSRTPDLEARLGPKSVLCEVKTINLSEAELQRRNDGSGGSIATHLSVGFLNKLKVTLETATDQMMKYRRDNEIKKIAFVVINYDDILHEYAANYKPQLDAFVASQSNLGLRVEFDIKPPFYWATA